MRKSTGVQRPIYAPETLQGTNDESAVFFLVFVKNTDISGGDFSITVKQIPLLKGALLVF